MIEFFLKYLKLAKILLLNLEGMKGGTFEKLAGLLLVKELWFKF